MIYFLLLTFILAPAYVIKFNLLHLPTDVLMLWVFCFWVIFYGWLIAPSRLGDSKGRSEADKKKFGDFIKFKEHINKKVSVFILLFLLAGLISLFVGGVDRANLGQFIVLFLEPMSLFAIAGYIFKQDPKTKTYLLNTIYCLLALAGIYAIIQYFTLLGLPMAWWGNPVEPKRALAFFVHPNFYALWAAPLLALLIPDAAENLKSVLRTKNPGQNKVLDFKTPAWLLGAIGLLFSLSRSGWLGLSAAIVVYLIFAADKKIKQVIFGLIIAAVLIVVAVPNLRWRLILPFYGEKSASSRIELWDDGLKGVKQSPIFGLGLTGFAKEYQSINIDPTLDTHNFPHNIFLNFWVETGLLGLISFFGLIYIYLREGFKNRQDIFKLGVALFLVAMVFQGLVDNPYFKNDLALVFWIILGLSI